MMLTPLQGLLGGWFICYSFSAELVPPLLLPEDCWTVAL
jgi:hypothetical protein